MEYISFFRNSPSLYTTFKVINSVYNHWSIDNIFNTLAAYSILERCKIYKKCKI